MAGGLPAITGVELASLLEKDGWKRGRSSRHGVALHKRFSPDDVRTTIVPNRTKSLAPGALSAILGSKQTGLGRRGLQRLLAAK